MQISALPPKSRRKGGAYEPGTVFEIARTASGYTGTAAVLVSFDADHGASPVACLIADSNGNLFGTTSGSP